MKSTRKRQDPKKKTEEKEKKMKQMGIRKGQRKKVDSKKKEKNTTSLPFNKTQTCAFWSTHIQQELVFTFQFSL